MAAAINHALMRAVVERRRMTRARCVVVATASTSFSIVASARRTSCTDKLLAGCPGSAGQTRPRRPPATDLNSLDVAERSKRLGARREDQRAGFLVGVVDPDPGGDVERDVAKVLLAARGERGRLACESTAGVMKSMP